MLTALDALLVLWLGNLWIALTLGGDFDGWPRFLLLLAALLSGAVLLLLCARRRRPAAAVLALAWVLSWSALGLRERQLGLVHRQGELNLAPERLAGNRRLLQDALLQVPCAEGVVLTLNRKRLDAGAAVLSVHAIPTDRRRLDALIVVLRPGQPLHPADRRRLEAYGRRGPSACRQGIATMVRELGLSRAPAQQHSTLTLL